jgi:hypothetical protein
LSSIAAEEFDHHPYCTARNLVQGSEFNVQRLTPGFDAATLTVKPELQGCNLEP